MPGPRIDALSAPRKRSSTVFGADHYVDGATTRSNTMPTAERTAQARAKLATSILEDYIRGARSHAQDEIVHWSDLTARGQDIAVRLLVGHCANAVEIEVVLFHGFWSVHSCEGVPISPLELRVEAAAFAGLVNAWWQSATAFALTPHATF
jgi:hypothetical protein